LDTYKRKFPVQAFAGSAQATRADKTARVSFCAILFIVELGFGDGFV
jgi:hypothetical protein